MIFLKILYKAFWLYSLPLPVTSKSISTSYPPNFMSFIIVIKPTMSKETGPTYWVAPLKKTASLFQELSTANSSTAKSGRAFVLTTLLDA